MKVKVHFDIDYTKDIMTYNIIIMYVSCGPKDDGGRIFQKYQKILSHEQTPRGHPHCQQAEYTIEIKWDIGGVTKQPLDDLDK